MVQGDGRIDLVVGFAVRAPPGLAGHRDHGQHERRLHEPGRSVDAQQLVGTALRVHDDNAKRLAIGRRRRPARRLEHPLQRRVVDRLRPVAPYAVARGDGLEHIHVVLLFCRVASPAAAVRSRRRGSALCRLDADDAPAPQGDHLVHQVEPFRAVRDQQYRT